MEATSDARDLFVSLRMPSAAASVFGVDRAVFTVEGSPKAAPDMHFEARMTKLEDLR